MSPIFFKTESHVAQAIPEHIMQSKLALNFLILQTLLSVCQNYRHATTHLVLCGSMTKTVNFMHAGRALYQLCYILSHANANVKLLSLRISRRPASYSAMSFLYDISNMSWAKYLHLCLVPLPMKNSFYKYYLMRGVSGSQIAC